MTVVIDDRSKNYSESHRERFTCRLCGWRWSQAVPARDPHTFAKCAQCAANQWEAEQAALRRIGA